MVDNYNSLRICNSMIVKCWIITGSPASCIIDKALQISFPFLPLTHWHHELPQSLINIWTRSIPCEPHKAYKSLVTVWIMNHTPNCKYCWVTWDHDQISTWHPCSKIRLYLALDDVTNTVLMLLSILPQSCSKSLVVDVVGYKLDHFYGKYPGQEMSLWNHSKNETTGILLNFRGRVVRKIPV